MFRVAAPLALAAVLLSGCGGTASTAPTAVPTAESAVISERSIADQGAGLHTRSLTEMHPDYNSNPPTSGWHYGSDWLQPQVYDQAQPDELMVHSLEHGMVVIHYREGLEQATVAKLVDLTGRLNQQSECAVLVPRPAIRLDVPIAVTAWANLLELRAYDEQAITAFFVKHVGQAPEKVCKQLAAPNT
ncbi:MAG TPA: DUF3105 domain-containing protein [Roseiflexaceae bacterium]|nr:DUF3105 domain-containing protein [Roseiflexaceae bacterium]